MIIIVLAGWLAGWLLFAGFRRLDGAPNGSDVAPTTSIVIPARDEEANLPRLLRSIQGSYEIIVVDDCSHDQTREVARKRCSRLIIGSPPPAGWYGKTWACQQGADASSSELLLFLDADTWLDPDALSTITNQFNDGALSIAPYHHVPTWREQLSGFFNLVTLAAVGPHHLLGQSLLVARETYKRFGGHRAVKDQVLENFALGKRIKSQVQTRLGRGVINVRMYPHGWRQMIDGWSKGFASGAARTHPIRFAMIIVWITGCVLAVPHVATYAGFVFQLWFLLRRTGNYPLLTGLFYPLPLLFFFFVFVRSVFRTRTIESISWKGRAVRAV